MKKWEKFQELLTCGDWHVHTAFTDGKNSVLQMCDQAVKNKLRLIAFTEHVRKDLDYDFDHFLREIQAARGQYPNLKILSGCETKVLDKEGGLDVSRDITQKCDIVIASFHSFPYRDKTRYIIAIENMIRNPDVDIWGHPTQDLEKYGLKLTQNETDRIIELCILNDVLIERNFKYPQTHSFVDRAMELGAKVVFSSDAHSAEEMIKLKA